MTEKIKRLFYKVLTYSMKDAIIVYKLLGFNNLASKAEVKRSEWIEAQATNTNTPDAQKVEDGLNLGAQILKNILYIIFVAAFFYIILIIKNLIKNYKK